eukprot:COSAG02_NODE_22099_length_763_cov_1.322289_1_plen_31_part_10
MSTHLWVERAFVKEETERLLASGAVRVARPG